MKIKLPLISIITLIFLSLTLIIGSSQITGNQQQKIYATIEDNDGGGESGSNDNDDSNNNDSIETNNDNNDGNSGEISDDESDNSNDELSSEDSLNEELTAENPSEITGEVVTGEFTPNFGITDNLQLTPPLSTDEQTEQSDLLLAEPLNPNVKDLLKEQSQTDIIQEIPFQITEPPVSKPSDPNVNRLTKSQTEQSAPSAIESLNPFVDLNDLLQEQSSTELVESTGPQLNPSGKEGNSEGTSTGILTNTSPKNPSDSFISSREPVVIPGPSYSEEDPTLEECVVEDCYIYFTDDEICRNGIDDDDDGRIDENPYCSIVPGKSGPAPDTSGILTPEQSTGPSPFGSK